MDVEIKVMGRDMCQGDDHADVVTEHGILALSYNKTGTVLTQASIVYYQIIYPCGIRPSVANMSAHLISLNSGKLNRQNF